MNNKHLSWNKEINNNFIIASRAYFLQSPTCTRVINLDYIVLIVTPMGLWCWSCFARGRGLVNGSATFRSVCMFQISMSPSDTWWQMELKRLLMCLVLLWNLDSFAKAIALVLWQKIFIGPDALGMTPRSDINSFIQTPSFAASKVAIYSASHVDLAMTHCLELHQLTAPPFNKNMYPVCDLESSESVSKLASTFLFCANIEWD